MTLRDEIANLYAKRRYGRCWQDVEAKIESENFADSILALLAPELEKARVLDEAREFLNAEEGKEVCNMVELVWIYNQLASIVLTKKEVGYVSVDKLG